MRHRNVYETLEYENWAEEKSSALEDVLIGIQYDMHYETSEIPYGDDFEAQIKFIKEQENILKELVKGRWAGIGIARKPIFDQAGDPIVVANIATLAAGARPRLGVAFAKEVGRHHLLVAAPRHHAAQSIHLPDIPRKHLGKA